MPLKLLLAKRDDTARGEIGDLIRAIAVLTQNRVGVLAEARCGRESGAVDQWRRTDHLRHREGFIQTRMMQPGDRTACFDVRLLEEARVAVELLMHDLLGRETR